MSDIMSDMEKLYNEIYNKNINNWIEAIIENWPESERVGRVYNQLIGDIYDWIKEGSLERFEGFEQLRQSANDALVEHVYEMQTAGLST